jgi:hypothetical protein
MKQFNFRTLLPHVAAIAIFLLLIFAYFPELLENKSLRMDDIEQHKGMSNELADYREKTGEEAIWTNAMFSGMPGYMISTVYKGNLIGHLGAIMKLGLPRPADSMFILMVGMYVLLIVLTVRQPLAIIGSAAYAFTSYNLLIMEAGHMSKVDAISWMPWVLMGVVLALRGKWILGGVLTALFLSLQIKASHLQITYYLMFILLFFGLFYLVDAIKNKTLPAFAKSALTLVIAASLGVLTNISSIYTTYDYGKDSIRGKSELTIKDTPETDGLDKEYALDYSYGRGESFSYMIPNVYGGASNLSLGDQKALMKDVDEQYQTIIPRLPQYWAETSTTGPFYAGALICFLCVLGFFLVKGPLRWAILASMILAFILSWGKNFEGFSVFMLENFPGYNKFRAVKMTLVITDFLIPLMAILGLNEVVKNPDVIKENKLAFYGAFALTGGLCLLFYLMPGMFFDFDYLQENIKGQIAQMLTQSGMQAGATDQWIDGMVANLETIRMEIFKADALRAFLFITAGAAILFVYQKMKFNTILLTALILVIAVSDLFSVDKRYVNKKDFVSNSKAAIPYDPSAADEAIFNLEVQQNQGLKGKIDSYQAEGLARKNRIKSGSPAADENKYRFRGLLANTNYRVLNLSTSTFNDAATSFYHKSVGGYSAVKLERYQELIEFHISNNIQSLSGMLRSGMSDSVFKAGMSNLYALNMLNAKYIIYNPSASPLVNPSALGNAWFVNEIKQVASANEEIKAMGAGFNPKNTAIVDKRFADQLKGSVNFDSSATIQLNSYAPNKLEYSYNSSVAGTVIFSEVYYAKGWNAFVDGNPAPHFRANYVLRGMNVPAGKHTIEFRFEPSLYHSTEKISLATSGLLLLLAAGLLFMAFRKQSQTAKQA